MEVIELVTKTLKSSSQGKGKAYRETEQEKRKKETMTYLLGCISTLMLHIDLKEQRRRHADKDGLKGSDGQMGKTY